MFIPLSLHTFAALHKLTTKLPAWAQQYNGQNSLPPNTSYRKYESGKQQWFQHVALIFAEVGVPIYKLVSEGNNALSAVVRHKLALKRKCFIPSTRKSRLNLTDSFAPRDAQEYRPCNEISKLAQNELFHYI